MFKSNSVADEIFLDMGARLLKNSEEDLLQHKKIVHAMELVAQASAAFDRSGMSVESAYLDELLRSMAGGCDCNDASGIGTVKPGESEKELANMKDHGTMFDKANSEDLDIDEGDIKDLERMFEDEK